MGFLAGIVTESSLIVNVNNKVYHVQKDHPNWNRLKEAYKTDNVDEFVSAYDVEEAIKSYVENGAVKSTGVEIVDGQVLYNGQPVHNSVVDTIQRMLSEGFNIKPMVNFLENLMKNPSYNSIKEMWNFIEAMGLTITNDGCFLAYKSVRSDYRDKYSGRIDNTPGKCPPRLDRSRVDDNPNNHCSHGYHVGALEYAGPGGWYNNSGDKVLICKVNPADVVSVPTDHSFQKMRCCYYEPVGEFQGQLGRSVYSGQVGDDYGSAPLTPSFEPECVYPDDLLEGNCYIGIYHKSDGTETQRFFIVEEVRDDHYIVELLEPEEHAGEYRMFYMSRLEEVYTWDGETDPDEIPNPYIEDQCECCGDHYCDGHCCDDEDEDNDCQNYW